MRISTRSQPVDPNRPSTLHDGGAPLLASTCCLGPLVLLGLGISGAWRQAIVTFDDAKASVETLTRTTKEACYPSTVAGSSK